MDLAFTPEQEELRSVVRNFLSSRSPEVEVRRLMATEDGYDPTVWRQMAVELGLHGLTLPEALGGSGFSWREQGIVLEEMGRALLCAPFLSTVVLAANSVLLTGDRVAAQRLLPGIAAGESVAALALLEESASWTEEAVTTRAVQDMGGWSLNGVKMFVIDGHVADWWVVAARTTRGVSLFVVDAKAPGALAQAVPTMDQTRKLATVAFESSPALLLGEEGAGWSVVRQVLDLGATALACEQVGGAAAALDMAVEYAKIRVQFGRPIGSFQAIKHTCANMFVSLESARSAAYYAAWAASEDRSELPVAASLAKAFCSESYAQIAGDNIQVHGGIGFTWEHSAHLYFKRAKGSEVLFGTPSYHRGLLADRIGL